jgi:hypothetical protein
MTDRWELYPRRIGDTVASIRFDAGIGQEIIRLTFPNLLKVQLDLKVRCDNGLSADEEFEALRALEDALSALIGDLGGIYVGRITREGRRQFYCYLDAEQGRINLALQRLQHDTGYDLIYAYVADPDMDGYWCELCPNNDERQLMADLTVIQRLRENGDDLQSPRRVDHWAYFERRESASAFSEWLRREGYAVVAERDPDSEIRQYAVAFCHVCPPTVHEIGSHTVVLSRKARELGGEYDGWATSIERRG